jgi:hypothetical protein
MASAGISPMLKVSIGLAQLAALRGVLGVEGCSFIFFLFLESGDQKLEA